MFFIGFTTAQEKVEAPKEVKKEVVKKAIVHNELSKKIMANSWIVHHPDIKAANENFEKQNPGHKMNLKIVLKPDGDGMLIVQKTDFQRRTSPKLDIVVKKDKVEFVTPDGDVILTIFEKDKKLMLKVSEEGGDKEYELTVEK